MTDTGGGGVGKSLVEELSLTMLLMMTTIYGGMYSSCDEFDVCCTH